MRSTRRQTEQITVRVPTSLAAQLRQLAAAEGRPQAEIIRDLLSRQLRRRNAAHAADPLTETLHTVLPAYIRPLHNAVYASRFDAIVARELAGAAALAAVMATGLDQEQAREIVRATESRAVKLATRRLKEKFDLSVMDAAEGGA